MKMGYEPLRNINRNSQIKIQKLLLRFLPFAIVAFIISLICTMASSAVNALESVYRYTVYFIVGMKWRTCLRVSSFAAMCNIGVSVITSIITVAMLKMKDIGIAERVEPGRYEILTVGFVYILFYVVTIIMPVMILKKSKPSMLLKNHS